MCAIILDAMVVVLPLITSCGIATITTHSANHISIRSPRLRTTQQKRACTALTTYGASCNTLASETAASAQATPCFTSTVTVFLMMTHSTPHLRTQPTTHTNLCTHQTQACEHLGTTVPRTYMHTQMDPPSTPRQHCLPGLVGPYTTATGPRTTTLHHCMDLHKAHTVPSYVPFFT